MDICIPKSVMLKIHLMWTRHIIYLETFLRFQSQQLELIPANPADYTAFLAVLSVLCKFCSIVYRWDGNLKIGKFM